YYFHPIGDVLRAAAPALPREATRSLRSDGFPDEDETLTGRAVATRKTLFVRSSGAPGDARRGAKQQQVLALLTERAEVSLEELRSHVRSPREIVRRLEARGLLIVEERDVAADPFFSSSVARDVPPPPNEDQAAAIARLVAALDEGPSSLLLPCGTVSRQPQ